MYQEKCVHLHTRASARSEQRSIRSVCFSCSNRTSAVASRVTSATATATATATARLRPLVPV
jgi:hypothetical protein